MLQPLHHLSEKLIALVLQPMSFSMTGYKEFCCDFLIYLHFCCLWCNICRSFLFFSWTKTPHCAKFLWKYIKFQLSYVVFLNSIIFAQTTFCRIISMFLCRNALKRDRWISIIFILLIGKGMFSNEKFYFMLILQQSKFLC